MSQSSINRSISTVLCITAGYLAYSIFFAWFGGELALFKPGVALFKSIHGVSLYFPLSLFLYAMAIKRRPFPRRAVLQWNLSLFPFLTLICLVLLIKESEQFSFINKLRLSFGSNISFFLLAAFMGLEILAIYRLALMVFPHDSATFINWKELIEIYFSSDEQESDEEEKKEEIQAVADNYPENVRPQPFGAPDFPEPESAKPVDMTQVWSSVDNGDVSKILNQVLKGPQKDNQGTTHAEEIIIENNSSDKTQTSEPESPIPEKKDITANDGSKEDIWEMYNVPTLHDDMIDPVLEMLDHDELIDDYEQPYSLDDENPVASEIHSETDEVMNEIISADPVIMETVSLTDEEEVWLRNEKETIQYASETPDTSITPADVETLAESVLATDEAPLSANEKLSEADEAGEKLEMLIQSLDSVIGSSTTDCRMIEEEAVDHNDISSKLSPEEDGTLPSIETGYHEDKMVFEKKKRIAYEIPVKGILADYPDTEFDKLDDDTKKAAVVLENTLREFKIEAQVTGIRKGPVITMFELLPSPGVKLSRIVNLQDNIALSLAASSVRIVAPIPGKHAVGIEVPNKKRAIVSFSEMVAADEMQNSKKEIPVVLGKDISGGNQVIDLARTPHLLVAGATGSGKSVCVNSLICSILYTRSPEETKLIMVDPKVVELKLYNDIPHLLTPVITEPKKALQALQWALYEMERRYALLDSQGVRDIKSYNRKIKERNLATKKLPYIVVLVDEFADLMATSGKELEGIIARLAAMSRAVGIHLVLATQRPSIDVITGLIKANFPSRIAFMVASKTDSRIIIDSMGAEKLLGRGDMLFTSAWDPFPARMQGAFLSEEEVGNVVEYVKTLGEPEYIDDEIFIDNDDSDEDDFQLSGASGDPMYDRALEIVLSAGKASASYLQRRLKVGYNRAARLVEEMEERGIVGPPNGSKPREIIHVPDRALREEIMSLS